MLRLFSQWYFIKIFQSFFFILFFKFKFIKKTLVIFTLTDSSPLQLGDYVFPDWSHGLGTAISISSLFGILGWMIYEVILAKYYKQKVGFFFIQEILKRRFIYLFILLNIKKTLKEIALVRDPQWKPLLHKNQKKWEETYKNEGIELDFSLNEHNNNKHQEYLSQVQSQHHHII